MQGGELPPNEDQKMPNLVVSNIPENMISRVKYIMLIKCLLLTEPTPLLQIINIVNYNDVNILGFMSSYP